MILKKRSNLETLFNLIDKTLLELSQKYKELIVLNINNFLDDRKLNFFDDRNWYLVNCRLSSNGHELISQYLYKILDKLKTTAKKVLILDCDNTLWGGVIGEDGIDNIQIGQDGKGKAFLDFQKKLNYYLRLEFCYVFQVKIIKMMLWKYLTIIKTCR